MIFLWTEDSKAGFHFWNLVNTYLFQDRLQVESKKSNQGILDAVRELVPRQGDVYYIAFDHIYDNMDVVNKLMDLQQLAARYSEQIILLDITCFEHIILSFSKLITWTGSRNYKAIHLRKEILGALNQHRIAVEQINDMDTLNYLKGFKHFSTERILKSLANNLTDTAKWSIKGNKMGACWCEDCCVLEESEKKNCGVEKSLGKEKLMELFSDQEMQHILGKMLTEA
ncbi:hypothetical protein B5F53_16370 [Blautia sp. An249]|nr:hypothetical protein B5F53_16370 [Blautia sp. An249]